MERFFEAYASKVERMPARGDLAGFYTHLKIMDVEDERECSLHRIGKSNVLQHTWLVCARWVG